MPAIVRVSHAAAYPDPIKVSARDRLTLTGDIEIWDEHRWFRAVAADCKSGWIPDNFVVGSDEAPIARTDYSATDLMPVRRDLLSSWQQRADFPAHRRGASETNFL
jgi:hypothetical protein